MWHYHLLYRSIVLSQEVQVSGCMHVYRQFSAAQLQRHSCYKANNARLKRCRSKFTLLLPVSPSKRCICRCNMLIWVSSKSDLENYMQKCAQTNMMCLLPNTKRCTSLMIHSKSTPSRMPIDVGQPSVFIQIVEVLGNFRCNSLMRTKCQPFDITSSKYRALAQLSLMSLLLGLRGHVSRAQLQLKWMKLQLYTTVMKVGSPKWEVSRGTLI